MMDLADQATLADGGGAVTNERDREFGFAPAYDAPIPYLQRIRRYYQALGSQPDEIKRRRAEFDKGKTQAKNLPREG